MSKQNNTVFFINHRFPHHAGASGYDRLTRYAGDTVPLTGHLEMLGDTLFRLPAKVLASRAGVRLYRRQDAIMEWAAARHMARHRGCVYHISYGEKSYRYLGKRHRRYGHRLVATFHHAPHQYDIMMQTTGHLANLDHAITVSRNQVDLLESLVGRGKVTFVPYGVDTDYFQPAGGSPSDAAPRCLFVGYHMRDFEALPRVIDGILAGHPSAEFDLLSRNPVCRSLADRPRVRCQDEVSDEDYRRLLQQSTLLVLPLLGSTALSAVNEALACGLPIVTTQGGIADYIDTASGILVPPGDANGMVEAAQALLHNPERLAVMREAARRRALELSWPRVAASMDDVYRRLFDSPR